MMSVHISNELVSHGTTRYHQLSRQNTRSASASDIVAALLNATSNGSPAANDASNCAGKPGP